MTRDAFRRIELASLAKVGKSFDSLAFEEVDSRTEFEAKWDLDGSDDLRKELNQCVRREIGALAAPERIQFAHTLPKTRSGKIMRRILRKIAEGETSGFGDTSTLADPSGVDHMLAGAREFQKTTA